MKKFFKKFVAVAAMAAVVATALPIGNAQAADCNHDYNRYCLGFYSYSETEHEYTYINGYPNHIYTWKVMSATCYIREVTHGDRQECVKCGSLTGGINTHSGSTIHTGCYISTKEYCSGYGTNVTGLY
ncbi:MAG: hypothetical protein ACI4QX_09230 [Lachnospiraceae bacterium]